GYLCRVIAAADPHRRLGERADRRQQALGEEGRREAEGDGADGEADDRPGGAALLRLGAAHALLDPALERVGEQLDGSIDAALDPLELAAALLEGGIGSAVRLFQ